jgi:hypothetical protein
VAGWSLVGAHWGPPPPGIQPGGAPRGAISVGDLSREELVGDSSGEKKREREERKGAIEELLRSDNCVGALPCGPVWCGRWWSRWDSRSRSGAREVTVECNKFNIAGQVIGGVPLNESQW